MRVPGRGSEGDQRPTETIDHQRPGTRDPQRPGTREHQGPETTRDQGPETTRDQGPETTRDQRPPETRDQRPPETRDYRPPETRDHQRPETTRDQGPETTRDQGPETTRDQGPETTRDQRIPHIRDKIRTRSSQPESEPMPGRGQRAWRCQCPRGSAGRLQPAWVPARRPPAPCGPAPLQSLSTTQPKAIVTRNSQAGSQAGSQASSQPGRDSLAPSGAQIPRPARVHTSPLDPSPEWQDGPVGHVWPAGLAPTTDHNCGDNWDAGRSLENTGTGQGGQQASDRLMTAVSGTQGYQ
ncbi:unnamed protein product [Gadus morhua 'NCC']